MIPSLRRLGRRAVFQHVNDPKHTSKTTAALLKKLRVKVMDWPSMSPDLNPIEHLWSILKRKVEECKVSNTHQLCDVIMEEWKRTPVATCEALVFDAGEYFGIMQVEEVEEEDEEDEEIEEESKKKSNPGRRLCYKVIVTNENGLQAAQPDSIFLIDHAWTYHVGHARQQLLQVPGLLQRMANLMEIDFHGEVPDDHTVSQVLEEMWKYNQTYQLSCGTAEEKVPVWYIMDEFGSRIQHSDEPTFATAPLFYMPQQIAYTVLWPLRDLETGGKCTYAWGMLLQQEKR
ncbi:Tubulin--tyrosine ligase-like protein 12 [Varanus komodoensis]|nr:Tubulin--tyrosine ligase-like protein 12 [Varanus komodoensis]